MALTLAIVIPAHTGMAPPNTKFNYKFTGFRPTLE